MERSLLPAALTMAGLLCGQPAASSALHVTPQAAWSGDFGLALDLADTDPAFIETDSPDGETPSTSLASTSTPTR
jgi:hypothetical protein